MKYVQILSGSFYIWQLLINGLLYAAEFRFIQNFTGSWENKHMVHYVLLSDLITFFVMYYQSPGVFRLILHMGIIICFSKLLLQMKWADTIVPAIIILTLFTLMEGFQAIFMRWLVNQAVGQDTGMILQMVLSGMLTLSLIMTLRFVSRKYAYTARQKISSYLYTLLLPCIFIVWVVRSGLGLDVWMNQSFRDQSDLWAFVWIAGAGAIFFIILKLDGKIITLSIQETEKKGLEDQIKKQYTYLEEAKKRNEQYRRFQHDINNHFLVLSGLIRERKYDEAEKYFDKLHAGSDKLLIGIETGNPVIDILLNEKINYAESYGIEVKQDVQISSNCSVEEMDLCIILANAVDNAVQACVKAADGRSCISITVRQRQQFLLIEVVNSMIEENNPVEYGTGLKNIKHVVEKYEGTMEIETSENCFRLTILLCLLPFTKMK